jgi:hypothetical protein
MKKTTKLKDLLNESVLGQLPSSQMFKYNKATGTYEAPGKHSTNEEIEDQLAERMPTEKKIGDSVTLADGESATIVKRMGNHKYAVKTDSGKNKVINIDTIREDVLTEEYIEVMDPDKIRKALFLIKNAWLKWKEGPLTEKGDIKPAQKELLDYITNYLKKTIK